MLIVVIKTIFQSLTIRTKIIPLIHTKPIYILMRNIAIIGAGQAGLLAGHALIKQGYNVTLFSDKSPEDFLTKAKPTGAAGRFNMALEFERELGLNHWDKEVPWVTYAHVTLCPTLNNRLMTVCGRLKKPGCAIDLRLQSHRWMIDLEKKGAKVNIEKVTVERLDAIAKEHDLTIVAAGREDIQKVFERDDARSTYTKPPRKLSAVGVTGNAMGFEGAPGIPVKFNLFPEYGECFWVPWYHKDHQQAWMLLVEAKEGGPLDRFDSANSGEQVVNITREIIKEMMPWDYSWTKDMKLADEHAWLVGSFVPVVKKPVGKLPSGRIVMPLGDTAISVDPIAGQGANCGNKMVRNLIECMVAHKDKPFDAEWMTATFEKFWARHHWIDKLSTLFLEPMTDAGKEFLIAAYGSTGRPEDDSVEQMVADAFANNFDDPAQLTYAFYDVHEARKVIEQYTRKHWLRTKLKGLLRIGKGQIRQKLGMDPLHPSTAPFTYPK